MTLNDYLTVGNLFVGKGEKPRMARSIDDVGKGNYFESEGYCV